MTVWQYIHGLLLRVVVGCCVALMILISFG